MQRDSRGNNGGGAVEATGDEGGGRRPVGGGRGGFGRAGREIRGCADGMLGWAGKELGGETEAGVTSGASGVEVVRQGLVEVEVWDGLGLGGIEGRRLVEEPGEEIALGRAARG